MQKKQIKSSVGTSNRSKKKGGNKKNFVLDTNVILHDYQCIEHFQENDLFIPIVVLEELDRFKVGSEQINFNARSFIRKLDEFCSGCDLSKGIDLPSKGRLFVTFDGPRHNKVREAFPQDKADNRVLNTMITVGEAYPDRRTILVTKDINLRVKARSIGLTTEDYFNDKVENVPGINEGLKEYDNCSADLIDNIYSQKVGIDAEDFPFIEELHPNECFLLKSDRNSALCRFDSFSQKIYAIKGENCCGISPRNAEQKVAFNILLDDNVKLVGLTGKAGTGKTLLALSAALEQADNYSQIILSRPIVALSNKDLGFLPGDEKQKIEPYMQPLFDNLSFIKSQLKGDSRLQKIEMLERDNNLVIEALAYIRGRSLSQTLIIVDEAQNLTPHEVKTIVTRAGENTKIIFTGDIAQIDSPYLDDASNGLSYMIDRMKEQNIFASVNLVKGERSELSEIASNLL